MQASHQYAKAKSQNPTRRRVCPIRIQRSSRICSRVHIIAGQQAVVTSLQDLSARQEAFIRDLNEQFAALQAINREQQKLLSHFRDYVEGDTILGDDLEEDKNLGDLLDGLHKLQGEGTEAGIDSVP